MARATASLVSLNLLLFQNSMVRSTNWRTIHSVLYEYFLIPRQPSPPLPPLLFTIFSGLCSASMFILWILREKERWNKKNEGKKTWIPPAPSFSISRKCELEGGEVVPFILIPYSTRYSNEKMYNFYLGPKDSVITMRRENAKVALQSPNGTSNTSQDESPNSVPSSLWWVCRSISHTAHCRCDETSAIKKSFLGKDQDSPIPPSRPVPMEKIRIRLRSNPSATLLFPSFRWKLVGSLIWNLHVLSSIFSLPSNTHLFVP